MKTITCGSLLDLTFNKYWRESSHASKSLRRAESLVSFFGANSPFEDITQFRLEEYIINCKEIGNSNATINRKLSVLSKLLKTARIFSHAQPVITIEYLKEKKGRIRVITDEEETALLDVNKNSNFFVSAVATLMDTGLRWSELQRAKESNIEDGCLYVEESKNETSRVIPLTSRAQETLPATILDIKYTPYSSFISQWNAHKSNEGLQGDPEFIPYACRHTFASRLVQRNVPLITVKELMGHKDIKMTLRYAHLSERNLREAISVLES